MSEKKSVQMQIKVPELNRLVTLNLSSEEADRAEIDEAYLSELVQEYVENNLLEHEASTSQEGQSSSSSSNKNDESSIDKSLFLWTEACVQLLLSLYEEHQDEFHGGLKRHKKIWENIAANMQQINVNYKMTWSQCQSKLNGLKKTYKKIVDHNGTSGNGSADRMNEIFGATGWIHPKAVATEAGPSQPLAPLEVNKNPTKRNKFETILENHLEEVKNYKNERKRQRTERNKLKEAQFTRLLEVKERQHKEKMEMLQKLCHLLDDNNKN